MSPSILTVSLLPLALLSIISGIIFAIHPEFRDADTANGFWLATFFVIGPMGLVLAICLVVARWEERQGFPRLDRVVLGLTAIGLLLYLWGLVCIRVDLYHLERSLESTPSTQSLNRSHLFQGSATSGEIGLIREELITKWEAVNSFSADFAVSSYLHMDHAKGPSETTGTIKWTKTASGSAYRIYAHESYAIEPSGEGSERTFESVTSYDGQTVRVWTRREGDEGFSLTHESKSSNDSHAALLVGGKALFKELTDGASLVFKGSDYVGDEPVYVFESVFRESVEIGGATSTRGIAHVCTDTGIPIRSELVGDDDRSISTLSYSNVETNIEMDLPTFSRPPSPDDIGL